MELQEKVDNLCILFIDPISEEKNKHLRDHYHELFYSGDYIQKYKHIKDSLNIEFSHQSIGIQLADFISGCTIGALKVVQE